MKTALSIAVEALEQLAKYPADRAAESFAVAMRAFARTTLTAITAAPSAPEQPVHETIVREGDTLTYTACGTSRKMTDQTAPEQSKQEGLTDDDIIEIADNSEMHKYGARQGAIVFARALLASQPAHLAGNPGEWLTIARRHGYAFPDARMQDFITELMEPRPHKIEQVSQEQYAAIKDIQSGCAGFQGLPVASCGICAGKGCENEASQPAAPIAVQDDAVRDADRETVLGIIAWLGGAAQGDRPNTSRGEAAAALQRLLAAATQPSAAPVEAAIEPKEWTGADVAELHAVLAEYPPEAAQAVPSDGAPEFDGEPDAYMYRTASPWDIAWTKHECGNAARIEPLWLVTKEWYSANAIKQAAQGQDGAVAWMLEFDDERVVTADPKEVEAWQTQHDHPYDVRPLVYGDTRPQPQVVAMTDDVIDQHLDAVLRASGSALRHYSLQKPKDDMRSAMRAAIKAAEGEKP